MSTIKVDEIQNSAGTTTFAKIENGQLTGALSPATGFRNRIINGDMRIDQRNNGAAVTPADLAYTLDRWQARQNVASKYSVQQSSVAPSGFLKSFLVTSLSAYSPLNDNIFYVRQNIEGFNAADLGWGTASAQSVTVSFWVRSSLTGSFGGAVTNSAVNRSYPFSYAIGSANTWEYKTVTVDGDTSGTWLTDNGTGLRLIFSFGLGSNLTTTGGAWAAGAFYAPTGSVSIVSTNGATLYITGVSLEKGTVATPFEFRSIGQELGLCQRYYERVGVIFVISIGGRFPSYYYKVNKRTAPTLAILTPGIGTPSVAAFTLATDVGFYQSGNASADTNALVQASAEL